MLALLCHVSPRSEELAARLTTRLLSDPSRQIDVLAWSFEHIQSLRCPDLAKCLQEDIHFSESAEAVIWVLISPSAASLFLDEVRQALPLDSAVPAHVSVVGIGPGTQELVDEANLLGQSAEQQELLSLLRAVDAAAPDAQRMLQVLRANARQSGRRTRLRVVKGESGVEAWIEELREFSDEVLTFRIYARAPMPVQASVSQRLQLACRDREAVVLVLPSAAALRGALAHQPPEDSAWKPWLVQQICLVPHPRLQDQCHQAGFRRVQLYQAGSEGLLDALKSVGELY